MQVPFSRPYLAGPESQRVAEVIASAWVTQGPRVQEFERAWADRVGARDAVATTSGTTALHLALWALGVRAGDEVVVPSLSFVATANAVWHCGATPVFADVDPATLNLDPASAEAAITSRTKAIMPVHQLGMPADMDAFGKLARAHGVAIVEDAACAIGAEYRGMPIGGLPWVACFSLHARKVITTGEGGMVTVQEPELAERLRRLRHHGMDLSDLARHAASDVVFESYPDRGWNARMTDIQAAMGLVQLDALEHVLAARRRIAERYTEALADLPGLEAPVEPDDVRCTWQSYAVRVDEDRIGPRLELMRELLRQEIHTRRGPTAIHQEASWADAPHPPLPESERAAREVLLLPIFADMTESQQDHVLTALERYVRRADQAEPAQAPAATRSSL